MALDTQAQNIAKNLLTKFGNDVTVEQVTNTDTSVQPWKKDSASTATNVVKGLVDSFSAFERSQEPIRLDDRRYMIAAKGMTITPNPGDKLLIGSTRYGIVDVDTIGHAPTGAVALYRLHVRK